ncbi:hypothetical protein CL632_00320 [bacterium]|jgi:hypothetical protein|nr:hypothetical protein [bacterium]MDP6571785.1 hypothetical protein [Patescibacteria group bacterium]MDP6756498.1 hypothetical protein [Patescibacteria group bacterium]|tara:strand:+ start:3012 stop:3776 length:765 start_codon:yes stop_codon:yes gene_type:complete
MDIPGQNNQIQQKAAVQGAGERPLASTQQKSQVKAPSIVSSKTSKLSSAKDAKKKEKPVAINFMAQWFNQYYMQVSIAMSLIILVFGYLFVLGPKLAAARQVSGEAYNEVIIERAELEQKLAYLSKLESSSAIISAKDIENIDVMIPSSPLTPQILTSIEDIARTSGVIIEGIDFVVPDEQLIKPDEELSYILPQGISVVEVSLAVASSPYDTLKIFLSNLEKNIRLMDVSSITYTPVGTNYTIILRAYYLSEQ